MRIPGWIARVLLALLFLFAGGMKLAGGPEVVAGFERLGCGQGFRVFVGACEVAGAVGLLLPPTVALAALGLAVLMMGAVVSHLTVLGGSPLAAVVVLLLCALVAWIERADFRSLPVIVRGKGPMDGWLARSYDRAVRGVMRSAFAPVVDDLASRMADARRVLDVGCGPGDMAIQLAERVPVVEVWGIDLAGTMIELALARAARSTAAGRLHFELADVTRLPFRDGEFDVVLSSGSIKAWPDPVAGLTEIHRVLAPGGRAFVAEMNRLAPPPAVAAFAARAGNWIFRSNCARVFTKSLTVDEAQALFATSAFGAPGEARLVLDGCVWIVAAQRAA